MYQNKANTKETITYLTTQKKKKKSTHLQLYSLTKQEIKAKWHCPKVWQITRIGVGVGLGGGGVELQQRKQVTMS